MRWIARQPSFSVLKQTGVRTLELHFYLRMSHQIRPGVRGGRDQFSWDQVKEDKQRLNYLGSSIHGVPDRFKKGPETFWYAKESKSIPESGEKDSIEIIKNKEKQMMETLLGIGGPKTKAKPVEIEPRDRCLERLDRVPGEEKRESAKHREGYSRGRQEENSRDRYVDESGRRNEMKFRQSYNEDPRNRYKADSRHRHSEGSMYSDIGDSRNRYSESSKHRYSELSNRRSPRRRSRSPRRNNP